MTGNISAKADKAAAKKPKKVSKYSKRKVDPAFYWMTIPAMILVCIFLYLPFLQGAMYSFTNSQGYGDYKFIGFKNYIAMFQDARVGHAYLFTIFIAILITLGTNILGRGFDFDIHLYSGAGAYVCGEGTALIRSIEGKAGRPRMKPPFIKVSGVFARPTCLNNVETLSLVPHLLLDEEGVYASCGSGESIGTKLVSVAGNVNHPGVFEIPFGTTVREILYELAGGIQHDRKIRLIQFGGASGKIADDSILDTPYTYEDLRAAGVMVGSGGMLVIDERTSVLDFLRMNQEFFWEESCGQCTPCREGNLHIKIILDKMATGTATREDIAIMMKIARVMSMSSLCGLGETAQNSLLSAMKVFPDLFDIGGARA